MNDPASLSPDGRWLTLQRGGFKIENEWISQFAVVDLSNGTSATTPEFKGQETYGYVGISTDGQTLYLGRYGDKEARILAYDMRTKGFAAGGIRGWDGLQTGFRTSFVASADAGRLFSLQTGGAAPNAVHQIVALDRAGSSATFIPLPEAQKTSDFEKYLLWSLALSPDGSKLYAVNTALGVVNEIDARSLVLTRTAQLGASLERADPWARLWQLLFPVAEAKRVLRSGAVVSPDGRTLYAVGTGGVAVIETGSMSVRWWRVDLVFDSLAISPDGLRLYATGDTARSIEILDARDGSALGSIETTGLAYGQIVRVEARP